MRLLALVLLALAALPARAETAVTCPVLAEARQVGNCPTEAELDGLLDAVCADDPICNDAFKVVKMRKNVALWETPDGNFAGYVTCAQPAEKARDSKLEKMQVVFRDAVNSVNCLYDKGVRLSHRTKADCALADGRRSKDGVPVTVDCLADAGACKALCK